MHIGRILLRAKTLQTGILNVTVTGRIKNSVLTLDLSHKLLSLRTVELGDLLLFESDPVGIVVLTSIRKEDIVREVFKVRNGRATSSWRVHESFYLCNPSCLMMNNQPCKALSSTVER